MKRLVTTLLLAGSGLAAMAQAPFTIFRPADGAKVREMVHVLIPVKSVPADGYLGIFINGKFVEATLPALDASKKYYEYDLDTKARGVPDGQLTLEAVLYVDFQDKPRIVDRSSVQVTVANTADNTIPAGGLKLAYKWTPGTQMVYDYSTKEILSESDAQATALGGRPDIRSIDLAHYRILYACDNAYPDGSGLVRMQALPLKGKEAIVVTTTASPDTPERFTRDQLYPMYEHLKSDGLEIWGSIPFNLPMEGTAGAGPSEILYTDFPLPTLPDKPVRVGQGWMSRFQEGRTPPADTAAWFFLGSVVEHYPARGDFKGIEWEMGHPCAKIVDSIAVSEASDESARAAKEGGANSAHRISETETIWFALDRRQILKIQREVTEDQQVAVENGFGGSSGAAGADSGGSKVAGPPPPPSGLLAGGQRQLPPPPSSDYQQSAGPPPPPGALQGGSGGGGLGRGGRSGGGQARTKLVKATHQETFILEL